MYSTGVQYWYRSSPAVDRWFATFQLVRARYAHIYLPQHWHVLVARHLLSQREEFKNVLCPGAEPSHSRLCKWHGSICDKVKLVRSITPGFHPSVADLAVLPFLCSVVQFRCTVAVLPFRNYRCRCGWERKCWKRLSVYIGMKRPERWLVVHLRQNGKNRIRSYLLRNGSYGATAGGNGNDATATAERQRNGGNQALRFVSELSDKFDTGLAEVSSRHIPYTLFQKSLPYDFHDNNVKWKPI